MAALENDPNDANDARRPAPGSATTRVAFVLTVMVLAVFLAVASRTETTSTTARTGRRVELAELIRAEQQRTRQLEATVQSLAAQVAALEEDEAADVTKFGRVQRRIDRIAAAAGLTPVRGPGLRTVLTDSALETAPTGNLNDLVIHEQDLQAVINALWAGGAEAISVNGQRVLATTAIRCVGNTLLLHGAVYSPPYVIDAVGDNVALRAELARDPAVSRFAAAATQFKLGFAVTDETLEIPQFEGATVLDTAQVAGGANR